MKTNPSTKVANTLSTQIHQENIKNNRKTLKVLQESADNKENLAGRSRIIKDVKLEWDNGNDPELKTKKVEHKCTQTGEPVIKVEDLTNTEEPSADYWQLLAENRGQALNDSLQENERLKEHVEALTHENETYKKMVEESKHLVDILKDMVGCEESDSGTEDADEGRERA